MNKHPSKVILDTNLLLLWLSVRTDRTLLKTFKRVQRFSYADFERLTLFVQRYESFATTPHILAETSNFVDQAPYWLRDALIGEFKRFVRDCTEIFRPAVDLIERPDFNALGLTDAGMAELSGVATVITVDFRLAGMIEAAGGTALNFSHLQSQ